MVKTILTEQDNAERKHWKLSKETREKMKGNQNAKGHKMSLEGKLRWLEKMKNKQPSRKGVVLTQEIKDKISKNRKGISVSIQSRKNYSDAARKRWENPEYAKKVLCVDSPNRQEKQLQQILDDVVPKEYQFVGNGKIVIGRKVPDFINKSKSKLIEMFGDFYHKNQNPQKRIDFFKEYGYQTLVIWASELKNKEMIKNKVLEFNQNG